MATNEHPSITISKNDNLGYNKSMDKRARWTILDVEEKAIKVAKKYAKKKGYQMGTAVSEIIIKSEKKKKEKVSEA